MSFKPSSFSIGLFTLVAILVAFSTVIYVGSVKLFSREETFLVYFNESVAGLSVGAPVKFRGVPIGDVSEIMLRYNQPDDSAAIPVFIKIDLDRLEHSLGVSTELESEESFYVQVTEYGLRARLEWASLISGQLYIELDYSGDPGEEPDFVQEEFVYKEIPTEPSVMARLGTTSGEVVAKLSTLDVQGISDGIVDALQNINRHLRTLDLESVQNSLIGAADSIEETLNSADLKESIAQTRVTLESIRLLSEELRNSSGPVLASMQKSTSELEGTLREMQQATIVLREAIEPGSDLRIELDTMISDLSSAARSMRELLDYLERNPNALLSGRAAP